MSGAISHTLCVLWWHPHLHLPFMSVYSFFFCIFQLFYVIKRILLSILCSWRFVSGKEAVPHIRPSHKQRPGFLPESRWSFPFVFGFGSSSRYHGWSNSKPLSKRLCCYRTLELCILKIFGFLQQGNQFWSWRRISPHLHLIPLDSYPGDPGVFR